MFKKSVYSALLALLATALVLSACQGTATPAKRDSVKLQLNWVYATEFTGYFVAKDKGFYAEEGLDVEVIKGGPDANGAILDAVKVLTDTTVEFAVLGFSERLRTGDQGVTLAAMYQISPRVLFSLANSGIRTPMDLRGKRLPIKTAGWGRTIYGTIANVGVERSEVITMNVPSDAQDMLYKGEVDIWTGFVIDEAVKARLAGYDINLIFPADYAVGTYDGLLTTRTELLQSNPDLVERFVRASLRGWQYTIEHTDEAAEVLSKWEEGHDLTFYRAAEHALVPLIDTGQVPIGWIDAQRWQRETETSGGKFNPAAPGYSMQFIKARNQ